MAERYVPARALDNTQFKENADGSLDVKVLVLSGEEMYRDEQGDFVIDLESVALHKPTLIMDYNHEESEVIGHISNLRYEDGGLWGDAHLFSARAGDRAEEVILRILGGTPYEISPTVMFYDSNAVVIPEGISDEVNGRTVEGPATIFLNTPIRGVSICPYGTDKYTGITTLKMDNPGEKEMAESKKTETALAHPDLEEMITEFGEADGLKYYRAGLSIDEARAEDYALLKAERSARLAAETAKLSEGGGEGGEGGGDGDGDDGSHQGDIQTAGNPGAEDEGGDETGGDDEPQPSSGEGEGDGDAPEGAQTKKKKKEEEEGLKAELTNLRAEIAALKATLRRGEEKPLDGASPKAAPDKRPTIFKQADVLRAKGID